MSNRYRQYFTGQIAFAGEIWVQCILCRLTVSKHPAELSVDWFRCKTCEKAESSHAELHFALARREVLPEH